MSSSLELVFGLSIRTQITSDVHKIHREGTMERQQQVASDDDRQDLTRPQSSLLSFRTNLGRL